MKKALSLVAALAVALSLGLGVCAEESVKSTTVSFHVDPVYEVTIPATVELTKTEADQKITYEKDLPIGAAAGVFLKKGEVVQVTMTSDFEMATTEGATLGYTAKVGNNSVANNGVVAAFGTDAAAQSSTLHITAENPTYAGNYTDTVTFNIAVVAVTPAV